MLATSSHQGCRCKTGAGKSSQEVQQGAVRLLLQLGAGKQHDAAVLLHVLHAGKASQRCAQQVAPLTAQRADSFPKTKSRHVVLGVFRLFVTTFSLGSCLVIKKRRAWFHVCCAHRVVAVCMFTCWADISLNCSGGCCRLRISVRILPCLLPRLCH